jgi:hypothetical protein
VQESDNLSTTAAFNDAGRSTPTPPSPSNVIELRPAASGARSFGLAAA